MSQLVPRVLLCGVLFAGLALFISIWPCLSGSPPSFDPPPQCGLSPYQPPSPTPPPLFDFENNSSSQIQVGPKYQIIHGHLVPNASCLPWMASLHYYDKHNVSGPVCSATIIGPRHVLTAGHCLLPYYMEHGFRWWGTWPLQDTDLFAVRVSVTDFAKQLREPLEFNATVQPICLSGDREVPSPFMDLVAVTAGWGLVKLPPFWEPDVINTEPHDGHERVAHPGDCARYEFFDPRKHVCTTGIDVTATCHGDSGGSLLIKLDHSQWTQIGVTSMGYGRKVCTQPDVYTRVSYYCDLIANTNRGAVNCVD